MTELAEAATDSQILAEGEPGGSARDASRRSATHGKAGGSGADANRMQRPKEGWTRKRETHVDRKSYGSPEKLMI
jgi:hypothetical protein